MPPGGIIICKRRWGYFVTIVIGDFFTKNNGHLSIKRIYTQKSLKKEEKKTFFINEKLAKKSYNKFRHPIVKINISSTI